MTTEINFQDLKFNSNPDIINCRIRGTGLLKALNVIDIQRNGNHVNYTCEPPTGTYRAMFKKVLTFGISFLDGGVNVCNYAQIVTTEFNQ